MSTTLGASPPGSRRSARPPEPTSSGEAHRGGSLSIHVQPTDRGSSLRVGRDFPGPRGGRAGTALAPRPDVRRSGPPDPTIHVVSEPRDPFRSLTLEAFVRRLASAEPVPGGGSASAIAASLGASLVAMVAVLSEGRPKYAAHAVMHAVMGARGRELADRFLTLADEDAAAYGAFSAAMKLPKETEVDRAARSVALRAAALTAAEVPLRCVEACRDLVIAAEALAGRSNVNASSDLVVASLLAEAAARGGAANVLVNLPSIGDEAAAKRLTLRVDGLLGEVERLAGATRQAVYSGVGRPPLPVGPSGAA